MIKKLYHGAAYYPELWSREIIDQDIVHMKAAGINVVRMGEFLWSRLEPMENEIDTSFLVEMVDLFYSNGIETILCTPTVTPPIWLTDGNPETLVVDASGTRMHHGARQHVCTNHPYFRERSEIIVEHMARAVGKHPGVILWQLDNELKSHVSECMCDTCKELWHVWLRQRYGTIENLNQQWGTLIWSELYQSFEQVPQPLAVPFLHNSSLSTMYRNFSREKIAEFGDEQAEAIRKFSDVPITTNGSIGFFVDNERLYKNLDVAGYDTYASSSNYSAYLFNADLWRNVKKGKNFWVLETSTSHTGALDRYPGVHPQGYLAVEAVSAYALGADGFCYWLWRQQRTGCEQIHGAVISAWGKPTLGYKEVVKVEKAREELEDLLLSTKLCPAELAITYSDRAKTFLLTEPHKKLNYRGIMGDFYTTVLNTGIHRDLILEGTDLEGYKILMTPFMHYVSDEYRERARAFVERGGIWIVGPLTGGRTEEHTIHTDAALGRLESLAGVETLYTYPMDGTGGMGSAFGVTAPLGLWSAVFRPVQAAVLGTVEGGLTPGEAFVTEHRIGRGKIVMLGSMPLGEEGNRMLQAMVLHYAKEAGIKERTDVSEGTVVVPRRGDGFTLWVVINMDGNGGTVSLPCAGMDVLENRVLPSGKLEIGRYEYKVVRLDA